MCCRKSVPEETLEFRACTTSVGLPCNYVCASCLATNDAACCAHAVALSASCGVCDDLRSLRVAALSALALLGPVDIWSLLFHLHPEYRAEQGGLCDAVRDAALARRDRLVAALATLREEKQVAWNRKDRLYHLPAKRRELTEAEKAERAQLRAAQNPYRDLPKVFFVESIADHGPCEGGVGSALCPHCGAEGRYVYHFLCEDGSSHAAMKGCFGHFPKHQFAAISLRLLEKEREYAAKGWKLPSWDQDILDAIIRCAHQELAEEDAWKVIRAAEARRDARRVGRSGR